MEEGGERGSGSGVGRDKRAKLLGPARLEICKSYVIRLDIRSVHDARIGKFDTERERGGWVAWKAAQVLCLSQRLRSSVT